jgi:hypothetical protein
MSSFARRWDRDSRRRSSIVRHDLEILERRAMLSGLGAGLFGSQAAPQATRIPTVITLESAATSSEVGQSLPLVATVTAAGTTARQVKLAQSETITGTIEFLTDSPHPIILGKVALNSSGQNSSSILSGIDSAFGINSQQNGVSVKDTAYLRTRALKEIGPYEIEARFLPANDDYKASTSASTTVTIVPRTQDAPTVTSLQAATNSVETGAAIPLDVTVENAGSNLADGIVKLTTVSPHPIVLAKISVGVFNKPVSITTDKLQEIGVYQLQATYVPKSNRFAGSTSAPVTVAVTPLTAASFRVTPVVSRGAVDQPLSFEVTALDAQGQPLTSYTGTVVFSSPTDSWTMLPPSEDAKFGIPEPSLDSPILARFSPASYTFTPADHGSHTFVGAVTFGKGGAETFQVTQADDPKVYGKTTFAIR